VNADVAERAGLRTGDRVSSRTRTGFCRTRIKVKATEAIRPDCVYMVHGFGHTSKMLKAHARRGASDAQLVTRYETAPSWAATGMNVNFVTLEREA